MTATPWFKIPPGARSLLALLFATLLSLTALAQTQTPIYPVPSLSPAFAGEVTGDFNGDGLPDQVYISSATAITVLLNQGATNPPTSVVTGGLTCTPQNLVVGDMNKDTKLDVVLTCQEGFVAVLFGNGDGTFQTPSYQAAPGVTTIAPLVDLNGDGYLDVAVGAGASTSIPPSQTYTVVVLLNKGASTPGTLASPKSFTVTNGSSPIGIGDFNGDSKQDIIIGSPAQVLLGNGDGTLQTPIQTAAATPYVAADLNNDGLTDIAYLSQPYTSLPAPASMQILLGASNGSFTTTPSQPIPGSENFSLLLPFKNTASSSIVNLALVGSDTLILLGDGTGKFTSGPAYGVSAPSVVGTVATATVSTQTAANGNTNLVFYQHNSSQNLLMPGNGDGTFQAPLTTIPPYGPGVPGAPVFVDLNGDGLTDILAVDFGGNLIASLGRGNGSFTTTTHNTGGTQPQVSFSSPVIVSGDFNGDGKPDAIVILPGAADEGNQTIVENAQMFFYAGNGDGTFKPGSAPVLLSVFGAGTPLVGDFNGDGKLDLIVPYGGTLRQSTPSGTLFFAGKGDGTFAASVSIPTPANTSNLPANLGFAADLNNDGKLDFVGQNTVSLGNGDGTFQQQPLGIPGTLLAVTDLNGDGKPDLLIENGVYLGNGDGTFQTSPYFIGSNSMALYAGPIGASIGDINGDGNPDILLQVLTRDESTSQPLVFFGDGKGNFVADPNTYYPSAGFSATATLARLNNQAPLPNDNKLDYVSVSSASYASGLSTGAVTPFLNLLNPASIPPAPLPSKTVLTASASSVAPGQQLTLTATVTGAIPTGSVTFVTGTTNLGTASITNGTAAITTSFAAIGTYPVVVNYAGDANNAASSSNAISIPVALVTSTTTLSVSTNSAGTNQHLTFTATVSGLNPTGTVTFASATATLGTASITNGVATLPFTFTTAGSYAVTASYAGDVDNSSSTSATVTVAIATPDYSITASPSSATISPGQSATTTLTVTPVGGYGGTVKFSCGTLPSGATCTFAPASVTPTSGAATSVLTITTTAPSTARLRDRSLSLQGIAWASFILLTLSPRKLRGLNRRLARATLFTLLLAAGLLSFSGCSSSSPSNNNPPTNPGTPAGPQTITLTGADSSGNLSHAINFQVTVQ
ncbi:FG-GAP-like repeat-containing protein [Tunturibacter psychrotolerans]|uniref:FG-GAP-like repeat-containing protein n=1 Tax=Tunturiibacter psychrotolerans TaxID=3069686 RepID=A0AAU7ZNA7_9BACT